MPPPEDGLNAKSGQEKIKVAKTLRRKDDKSETEKVVLADSSNEHESIVGWGCYPNSEKSIQSHPSPEFLNSLSFIKKFYPLPFGARAKFSKDSYEIVTIGRHSERLAKESSLLQYKAAAKNENNSTETDQASMPLGIFASKSASDVGIAMPTYFKDLAAWLPSCLAAKKAAFTLAKVLITLGIIGVVAALTLPTVINKAQSMILKNQFKKAYSTFYNAMKLVQVQNGAPMACWYWDNSPYGSVKCIEENQYGNCTKWTMEDGSSMPKDYNGNFSDCRKFSEDLIKTMKVIKFCEKDALKNGCLTESYRGADKVNSERDPNKEQDPNQMFSDSAIKKNYPAFITPDGTLYVRYGAMFGAPIFMVDVNGHKGPNKWGYDIFSFDIIGNPQDGMTNLKGDWYAVEPNGKSFTQMLQSF